LVNFIRFCSPVLHIFSSICLVLPLFWERESGIRKGNAELGHYRDLFMEMAHAVGPEAGLRQMRALLSIAEPFGGLDRISCPTVILGGGEDQRTPPAAHEALAAEIPGARLVMVEGAAHFTPLEQPEKVSEALREWMMG